MTQEILPTDARLRWHGAASLQTQDDWAMPWRISYADRVLFAQPLTERAAMPAGVRLTFQSNTSWLAGHIQAVAESSPIDLYCNHEFMGSVDLSGQSTFRFDNLPAGDKLIELWLPQFGEFRLRGLAMAANATLTPDEDNRPRWITYGSSITQCRTAASPSQTWPAIVARAHGLNLTCLGFGGQCHLDTMIARQIRDTPADYLSLCVGINIYGGATLNPRTFGPSIMGFVQIVREGHPETPLVIMSPIYACQRETTTNAAGFTLEAMRVEVAHAVTTLHAHGDTNIHYVDGLEIFGAESLHLLPDDLHPDAEGYQLMGGTFTRKVAEQYFVKG